jgi:hypothetical protein
MLKKTAKLNAYPPDATLTSQRRNRALEGGLPDRILARLVQEQACSLPAMTSGWSVLRAFLAFRSGTEMNNLELESAQFARNAFASATSKLDRPIVCSFQFGQQLP